MNEFDDGMRQWNNKCPKCGSRIHYSLRSGKLGASSTARCGNNMDATRSFTLEQVKNGEVKICSWEGKAIRMWDGSVRFKDTDGRYLFEWK